MHRTLRSARVGDQYLIASRGFFNPLGLGTAVYLLLYGSFCGSAWAQGSSLPGTKVSVQPSLLLNAAPSDGSRLHTFWDKKNRALFATVAALNVADFTVTRANLQNGGRELNPVVRVFGASTPALAANFAGGTASVIGMSYLFHITNSNGSPPWLASALPVPG
jgi:hypothetical protein